MESFKAQFRAIADSILDDRMNARQLKAMINTSLEMRYALVGPWEAALQPYIATRRAVVVAHVREIQNGYEMIKAGLYTPVSLSNRTVYLRHVATGATLAIPTMYLNRPYGIEIISIFSLAPVGLKNGLIFYRNSRRANRQRRFESASRNRIAEARKNKLRRFAIAGWRSKLANPYTEAGRKRLRREFMRMRFD